MLQLSPREVYTIARGLEDHTDNTVYYVRAVIRNARTDALIETVDLENQGDNHRYTYPWQVPADTSGAGFYILITTSVYTDSGYTTKSGTYGDKYDTYLVQDRMNPNLAGGGGGADVDYKKVRKIVSEELAKLPAPATPESINLKPLQASLEALRRSFEAFRIPEAERVDLGPVIAKLEAIQQAVQNIKIPETDLSGLEFRLDKIEEGQTEMYDSLKVAAVKEQIEQLFTRIKEFFDADLETLKSEVKGLNGKFDKVPYMPILTNNRSEQETAN